MVIKQHHPTRPRLSPFPTRWRRWPSPPQPCASLADASISPNTRRAYLGALARLDAWRGAEPLTDSVFPLCRLPRRDLRARPRARVRGPRRGRRPVPAKLAGQPNPAGEATARVLGGYRRTGADRGRQATGGARYPTARGSPTPSRPAQ